MPYAFGFASYYIAYRHNYIQHRKSPARILTEDARGWKKKKDRKRRKRRRKKKKDQYKLQGSDVMSAEQDRKPFRVFMWCVPRSISTAIAKCFSYIDNTQVWFEPFCLAFFQEMGMKHHNMPMPRSADEYIAMVNQGVKGTPMEGKLRPELTDFSLLTREQVRKELDTLPLGRSVFLKDMAYGITGYLEEMLPPKESGFKHTFLIRDPERMFPSWRNLLLAQLNGPFRMMRPGQKMFDEATFDLTTDPPFMMPGYTYKCQYDLWKYVKENFDPEPVVVDVDELVANPEVMLPKYFRACGMPWDDRLLSWEGTSAIASTWKTLRPLVGVPGTGDTGVTHATALSSTHFKATKPKMPRSEMKPDVIKAVDETMKYYEEMAKTRITVT